MGTHPIFESDFDCLTEMNCLINRTCLFRRSRLYLYQARAFAKKEFRPREDEIKLESLGEQKLKQFAAKQQEKCDTIEDFEQIEQSKLDQMPRNPDDDPDLEPHEQDAGYGKTSMTMLSMSSRYSGMITIDNVDGNLMIVKAQGGALYRVKGSLMCMKDIVLSWKAPEDVQDWNIQHFSPIFMIHPKTFLVIVGTGDLFVPLPPDLISEFKCRFTLQLIMQRTRRCGHNAFRRHIKKATLRFEVGSRKRPPTLWKNADCSLKTASKAANRRGQKENDRRGKIFKKNIKLKKKKKKKKKK